MYKVGHYNANRLTLGDFRLHLYESARKCFSPTHLGYDSKRTEQRPENFLLTIFGLVKKCVAVDNVTGDGRGAK